LFNFKNFEKTLFDTNKEEIRELLRLKLKLSINKKVYTIKVDNKEFKT